jgi:hypothetical protein
MATHESPNLDVEVRSTPCGSVRPQRTDLAGGHPRCAHHCARLLSRDSKFGPTATKMRNEGRPKTRCFRPVLDPLDGLKIPVGAPREVRTVPIGQTAHTGVMPPTALGPRRALQLTKPVSARVRIPVPVPSFARAAPERATDGKPGEFTPLLRRRMSTVARRKGRSAKVDFQFLQSAGGFLSKILR